MKAFIGGNKKDSVEPAGASAALLIAEKTTKNESLCKSMTLKNRLYGWFICLCVGCVVAFFSSSAIRTVAGNGSSGLIKFFVLYLIGTCCAFGSSLFLWGPAKQCKSMFDKTRRVVTCVYLGAIFSIITLVLCRLLFFKDNLTLAKLTTPLLLLLLIIQYAAYFWYTLSFVPMGRTIFCKCLKK